MSDVVEMLKDPKKRALGKLILFFIFFVFVFIVLGLASNEPIPNYEDKEEIKTNIYNYKYTINDIIIIGKHDEINDSFTINNIEYKLKGNNYVDVNNNVYMIDNINISYFTYDNILKIISNKEYLETTTYQDKSTKTIYQIGYKEFGIDSELFANVIIYKNLNNFINKCELVINNYNIILEYGKL